MAFEKLLYRLLVNENYLLDRDLTNQATINIT